MGATIPAMSLTGCTHYLGSVKSQRPAHQHLYTAAARLASRQWARGTTTSYTYTAAGDPLAVTYSDGTTGLTNPYARLGRRNSVTHGAIETIFGYDSANDLLGEINIGGILNDLFVTNAYDSLLRRISTVVVTNFTI